MSEIAVIREQRETMRLQNAARARASFNSIMFALAFGVSGGLFLVSVGSYALWPIVVYSGAMCCFGWGFMISVVEYVHNQRPVTMPQEEDLLEDEPAVRMQITRGNTIGLSRIGLRKRQWRKLADTLLANNKNWTKRCLQDTGIWKNLGKSKYVYQDIVKDFEGLHAVEVEWSGSAEERRIKKVMLTDVGWQAIEKLAGLPIVR